MTTKRIKAGWYVVTTSHGVYTIRYEERHRYADKVWALTDTFGNVSAHETKREAMEEIAYVCLNYSR